MDNAKEALKELFGISEVQAVVIEKSQNTKRYIRL